ncbi:MAG TPA: anti-sigma factor [Acidimicrobiia bacterium]|nr:anti-sigma factor [Acidimicrobiia bacterium]
MSDERLDELIAAYALGALDADEAATVERALVDDPDAAAAFDAYLETAAALATGDEPAPAALWARIADETRPAEIVPLRRPSRVLAAMSAAAVAVVAVLGIALFLQRSELSDLRSDPLTAAVDAARGEEGTLVVALTGEVNAEVVLGRDGVGYLVSEDLPPLSSESTYQLWAIVDDRVISAGVLGSAPSVAPFNVDGAAAVDGFALTIEVRGGVVSSEHAPVSLGLVEA